MEDSIVGRRSNEAVFFSDFWCEKTQSVTTNQNFENQSKQSLRMDQQSPTQEQQPSEEKKISIEIQDNNNDTNQKNLMFKLKVNTKLRKLKEGYAKFKGIEVDSVTYLYNGKIFKDDDTPLSLGMDFEGDHIDVMPTQWGGRSF